MNVILAKPYNLSDHIQPSLGLGYLATSIRNEHKVEILDCIKDRINIDRLSGILKKRNPDVLGLQCYTFDIGFIRDALSLAKRHNRDMKTVIGGPHPSAQPDETFKIFGTDLDFLFVGEAETGFPRLLDSLSHGKRNFGSIPGLAWVEKGELRQNQKVFIEDLDSLGMPAWDLIHPERYPESQHGAFFKNFPIAPILITRGCPYPCTFCAGNVVSGRKIRRRSIDNVLGELIYLRKDFGIKEFHIVDDNFTMDAEYAKEFLRRLKSLGLGMSWAVPNGVRMETLDDELLELMKDTGLYLISLGIESGSDRMLRLMRKQITTKKIKECVNRINDAGIDIAGFFILGFPGETEQSVKRTIVFATKLKLVRANFFTYLPFPGSESYRQLHASDGLRGVDLKHFYFMNAAYVPDQMTRGRLRYMQRAAFSRFYLRPRIIFYNLKAIKSLRHFFFLLKRFFHWMVMS